MHRLWLVRHGETASNASGQFQGHLDVPLNDRGRAQATALASALAGVSFDLVMSSDLLRAAETATLTVNGRHVVEMSAALREMHYGILQGVQYSEAAQILAAHGLADDWASGSFGRRGLRLPEGESPRQVQRRLRTVLDRVDATMQANPQGSNSMLVAHGGTLSILTTMLLQLPLHRRVAFRYHNCSVTRMTRIDDGWQMDGHNLDFTGATTAMTAAAQQPHLAGEADQPRS